MRALGKVAIVFVGLMALIEVPARLWDVGSFLQTPDLDRSGPAVLVVSLGIALLAGLGIALIVFSEELAARWFSEGDSPVAIEPRSILRLALLIFGYTTVAYALIEVVSTLGLYLSQYAVGSDPSASWLGSFGGFSLQYAPRPITQLLIGAATIRFAGGVADMLWASKQQASMSVVSVETVAGAGLRSCPECGTSYEVSDYRPGAVHRCVNCGAELP